MKELHPEVDFETAEGLIDDGILDSLDMVTLVTEVNDRFDVSIPPEEIYPKTSIRQKTCGRLSVSLTRSDIKIIK